MFKTNDTINTPPGKAKIISINRTWTGDYYKVQDDKGIIKEYLYSELVQWNKDVKR